MVVDRPFYVLTETLTDALGLVDGCSAAVRTKQREARRSHLIAVGLIDGSNGMPPATS